MDDADVMVRVNQASKEAVGWYDSRLSKERQRVINYYNSQLPKRRSEGSSSYISTDVYDSLESMKSQIVETFAANPDNLVAFPPLGPQDVEQSRIATEYCNHVFFSDNEGLSIIHDTVHDGLSARVGVVKVFWDDQTDKTEETFNKIAYPDVQALVAHPEVSDMEANADEGGDQTNPTYSGKLTRAIDKSKVSIDVIAPEEFLIKPRTRKLENCGYCGHRTLKTKAELIRMGYDPQKVNELHYDDDKGLDLSPEVLAREAPVESALAVDNPVQEEVEQVMLYESYIRMDIDGTGVKLWKICHVTDVMLSKQEVDRVPFKIFVPLPIPHTWFGNNFAQRVIPTQNARTVLTRGILDHTAITTNPRWTVLKGGLLNPREMLDNRLGGVVNINRPDAVNPLEQQNLNPFVFQTLEMLKQNKEESTGISALSQGMNKDAISTQNSQGLVDNLVTLSMQRQKIVARNFGKFLADVYLEIYRLVLENQDKSKAKIIKVAGDFVPVSIADWVERNVCKVALHLGYGERDRQAAKYDTLYGRLKGNPMFTPKNEYQLIVDGMRAGGFENYAAYITPPEQVPPAPPNPKDVAEGKAADAKATTAQAAMVSAQANAVKDAKQADVAELKAQIAELTSHVKSMLSMRAEARKDAETANRIKISNREMALAEAAAPGKETDVVAPHG
jgi:hypothetical protein